MKAIVAAEGRAAQPAITSPARPQIPPLPYTSFMTDHPTSARPGRNQPCHCGSGRKYKHCCLEKDDAQAAAARAKASAEAAAQTSEATAPAPRRPAKHQTQQPWKTTTSRGFVARTRT